MEELRGNLDYTETESSLVRCQVSGKLPELTPTIQAFESTCVFCTDKAQISVKTIFGGHISLSMGIQILSRNLFLESKPILKPGNSTHAHATH